MTESPRSQIHMRFRMVFDTLGLTQMEFGNKVGLSQGQVSTIVSGKGNVPARLIQLLWHVFRVNPDFILKGSTPMFLPPKRELIPILGDIPAGDWEQWIDSYPPGVGDGYLDMSDVKGENLFAVRVKGDSMEPMLRKGDVLVIDPHREFIKGFAVVRHSFGGELSYKIRSVVRRGNLLSLTPCNPAFEPEDITPNENTRLYVPVKVLSLRDL